MPALLLAGSVTLRRFRRCVRATGRVGMRLVAILSRLRRSVLGLVSAEPVAVICLSASVTPSSAAAVVAAVVGVALAVVVVAAVVALRAPLRVALVMAPRSLVMRAPVPLPLSVVGAVFIVLAIALTSFASRAIVPCIRATVIAPGMVTWVHVHNLRR